MIRRGFLLAALVVVVLALGPFAAPLTDDVGTSIVDVQVDHRNDVPVVQRSRPDSSHLATELPSTRSLLVVVVLVAGLLLAAVAVWRRHTPTAAVARLPSWSRPPRRGPPVLAAG